MKDRSRTWGWRHYAALAIVLALIGVAQLACSPQQPTAPGNIIIVIDNTQTQGGPTASPAPGAGANGVASVTVNGYGTGNLCPAGVVPPTGTREVKVGCRQAVTCNPRDINGRVIFDLAVTGPAPDDFSAVAGNPAEFVIDDNPFNGEIHGLAPGPLRLSCTVKGKVGTADFTVVP